MLKTKTQKGYWNKPGKFQHIPKKKFDDFVSKYKIIVFTDDYKQFDIFELSQILYEFDTEKDASYIAHCFSHVFLLRNGYVLALYGTYIQQLQWSLNAIDDDDGDFDFVCAILQDVADDFLKKVIELPINDRKEYIDMYFGYETKKS